MARSLACQIRNHTCANLDDLMVNVRVLFLIRYFRILDQTENQPLAQGVVRSRTVI